MADTTITIPDLGSLTSGQASDLLLATRGTTGYKMLLSDLAKYMVETYNSSSLAGSAQSVKNALDSLNSRTVLASVPIEVNSEYITSATFNAYNIGAILVISGWFQFISDSAIPSQTTLLSLGNNKKFQTRYYMPIYNANDVFSSAIECRENTNIARARISLAPVSGIYYYFTGACCIK